MKAASVLVIVMVMVILTAILGKPDATMCAVAPMAAVLFIALQRRHGCDGRDGFENNDGVAPATTASCSQPDEQLLALNYESTPDPKLNVCAEHAPPDAWHPKEKRAPLPPGRLAEIAKENACVINELYGRRSSGSIDDRLLVHTQRIGDRDRQATINQVSSRRNNVMEPYFRQELSERNSERWWEADNMIPRIGNKRWNDTVDMNRDMLVDENVDGIYGEE